MFRYISIDRIINVYDVTLYTYIGYYNVYVTLYYNYPERICVGKCIDGTYYLPSGSMIGFETMCAAERGINSK